MATVEALQERVERLEKELQFTKDRLGQTLITTVLAARGVLALARTEYDIQGLKRDYGPEPERLRQLERYLDELIETVLRGRDAG